MADSRLVPVEELLAHRQWVRNLARSLVRDVNAADDLEQEAWLAALNARVRGDTPRAWFATVLRRLTQRASRSAARRERREHASSAGEAVASPFDTLVRAEAHERIVHAVMS